MPLVLSQHRLRSTAKFPFLDGAFCRFAAFPFVCTHPSAAQYKQRKIFPGRNTRIKCYCQSLLSENVGPEDPWLQLIPSSVRPASTRGLHFRPLSARSPAKNVNKSGHTSGNRQAYIDTDIPARAGRHRSWLEFSYW